MTAHLQRLADLSVLAFVVSTMLTMGMSQPLADVIATLTKPSHVALALLVNFVAAPLFALALSRLIPLQPAHASGLLLLGAAAGAPFLPKLAAIAGGNVAYSVALMVLLMGGSIVFMPFAVPLMAPGLSANAWVIAKPLIVCMVIPLAIGFLLARSGFSWVQRLTVLTRTVSNAAFVLLIVLMTGLHVTTIVSAVGSLAIGTYALFLLTLAGVGYMVGAIDKRTQAIFALGAASRNIPAALVIAGVGAADPAIAAALVVAFVVSLVVLLGLARAIRPRGRPRETFVT